MNRNRIPGAIEGVHYFRHNGRVFPIVRGGDGRGTQKPRLPGIGTTRVYVFTNKWADAE